MVLSTVELYGLNGSHCAKSVILSCGVSCAKDWEPTRIWGQLQKENNEIIGSLSNNVLFIFASSLRYS